eukprot:GILK01006004.1.p1 GENE.GILK01006004.1~~GILK01006004.1.p1  ORF type:complete len:600 (+),score=148.53 GILK01006004.1:217-2016(+)
MSTDIQQQSSSFSSSHLDTKQPLSLPLDRLVLLKNLNKNLNIHDVKMAFSTVGDIDNVFDLGASELGKSFALLFDSKHLASTALMLNGSEFMGSKLNVEAGSMLSEDFKNRLTEKMKDVPQMQFVRRSKNKKSKQKTLVSTQELQASGSRREKDHGDYHKRHEFMQQDESVSASASSSSSASFEEAQAAGALDTAVQWPSSELLHSESISESVTDAVLPKSVLSDSRRIQQIIINVLSNAVKYTSKGSVTCSLSILQDREDDMTLEIAIRDTGTGFTKPLRLQSLEQNVKGEGGLGLYICRRLCEVMGGELIIESTPNVGTLVRVSIVVGKIKVNSENSQPLQTVAFPFRQAGLLESPVYDPSTASADTNSHPRMLQTMQNVLTQRRVLVVEDNDFNAFVVSAMLTKDGFDVSRANNGLQCINMLEDALRVKGDFDFDLILMDYQMPEMDGVMTTQRIREIESKLNRPPIPVVALTALSSSKDRDRLLAAGMDAFLSKPVCRPSLYSTATHLISLYRQSRTTTSSTASSTSASASIFRSTSGTASRITTTVSTRQTVRTVRTVDVQDVSEVNENQPQAGVILTNQDKTEKDISVEEARQ